MKTTLEAEGHDWIKHHPQVFEGIAETYHESRFGGKWGRYDLYETTLLLFSLLSKLRLDPRKLKMLDVGCGTGKMSIPLAQAGTDVTCLDAAKGMLEQCSLRAVENHVEQRIHLELASADKLPYPEDTFDCVVASRFLLLFPISMYPLFLNEMLRVVKPGGYVIVEIKNKYFGLVRNYIDDMQIIRRGGTVTSCMSINQVRQLQDRLTGGKIIQVTGCLLPRANLVSSVRQVSALLRGLSYGLLSPITFSFFAVIQKEKVL